MSESASDTSSRLDALEMRIVHQDRMMAELNEVITAQWRKIDGLERHLSNLREEFQNINVPRGAPEPPPPHY